MLLSSLVYHAKCVTTDHKMMVLQSVSPCHLHLICSIPATGEKPTVIYCKHSNMNTNTIRMNFSILESGLAIFKPTLTDTDTDI